ncbi:hypothetical protein O181_021497 [Austropuccinia psidii MF-1]|uniref:Uncharacterized protein n=1 Tax=Austropuccinia psidii MF-1 TaxID=1389203 RepID=A0A9Q3GWB2_9BASI|nr:hypothetical protein [Austropuccinia psidii MF-1]
MKVITINDSHIIACHFAVHRIGCREITQSNPFLNSLLESGNELLHPTSENHQLVPMETSPTDEWAFMSLPKVQTVNQRDHESEISSLNEHNALDSSYTPSESGCDSPSSATSRTSSRSFPYDRSEPFLRLDINQGIEKNSPFHDSKLRNPINRFIRWIMRYGYRLKEKLWNWTERRLFQKVFTFLPKDEIYFLGEFGGFPLSGMEY